MKKILFIFLIVFVTNSSFAGGGWPKKKGTGYFKLGQSMIRAGSMFQPDGSIMDITTLSIYSTGFYGEYGLTDRLTVVADVPFFVRSTLNEVRRRQSGNIEPGDEVNSIGDPTLGFQYGLITEGWLALSASVFVGIPLGETSGGNSGILQTGDGEFNQMIMLDASHSFYPSPYYTTVSVGFNNRTNGFSEEFRYGFEIGYTGIDKFLLALKINGIASFYNGDVESMQNGIFNNNTEYLAVTPEVNYFVKDNWGISAAAGFAPYAKRIIAAPNFSLGAFLTF